jgi:hypothetical protein
MQKKKIVFIPLLAYKDKNKLIEEIYMTELRETVYSTYKYNIINQKVAGLYYLKIIKKNKDITNWDIAKIAEDLKVNVVVIGEYDYSGGNLNRLENWIYDYDKEELTTYLTKKKENQKLENINNSFITLERGLIEKQIDIIQAIFDNKEKQNKWYTFWAFGTGWIRYPDKASKTIDRIKNRASYDHYQVTGDLVGLYYSSYKYRDTFLIGMVFNGDYETFYNSKRFHNLTFLTYSISAMHFINSAGNGIYIRVDMGVSIGLTVNGNSDSVNTSNLGLGLLFGIGYAIPLSCCLSICFTLTASNRYIESNGFQALNFSAGGLYRFGDK